MRLTLLYIVLAIASGSAVSQTPDPADQVCPHSPEGSVVQDPPALYSKGGRLELTLNFRSAVDAHGLERYCYATDTGLQSPTLHLRPNDRLIIHLHNGHVSTPGISQMPSDDPCKGGAMGPQFTNLHFHGLSVAPTCHSDETLKTLVGPGQTFDYEVQIPANESTGLYWYHPHVHGYGEAQVQGGASGAIVIDGIESGVAALKGLPERTLILRDQLLPGGKPVRSNVGVGLFDNAKRATQKATGPNAKPSWDVSLNHIPIIYPGYTPAVIQAKPHERQFWRVLNAAADTIFDLQLIVNGTAQPLDVVAVDGVPLPRVVRQQSIPLSPGGRVEFIVVTPGEGDRAKLITQNWETGPDGEVDPTRPLADIVAEDIVKENRLRSVAPGPKQPAAQSLLQATPALQRKLYFSEKGSDESPTGAAFFLTVEGQQPDVFRMGQSPNMIAHQGTVEDWTIENRALQDHVFHIHQIHFKVLEINGKSVPDSGLRDTIDIPYYDEKGPYPSVKLRMDFRDPRIIGTFVFHCHILQHQDQGMMGTIQVAPPGRPARISIEGSAQNVTIYDVFSVTASLLNADAKVAKGSVQFVVDHAQTSEAALTDGRAQFTGRISQAGKHIITATYLGDANLAPSPSTSLSINVVSAFFTLSPSADIELQSPSRSAGTPITVNAIGGFQQPVRLSCALPKEVRGVSCSVAPSVINGSGLATLTVANQEVVTGNGDIPKSSLGLPPTNYAVTVLAISGSGDTEIRKTLIVKLRVK